ncbi:hypothetical protein E4T56_gene12685 [Termitomyces sp. T112]|nr:hypothetical protein E4T56_gene12685 [Termitomyces sp. T112]
MNWTQVIPRYETIEAAIGHMSSFVGKHRYLASGILLLWSIFPEFPFKVLYTVAYKVPRAVFCWVLSCFGFTEDGISPDSFASRYQSREYGGNIPRDSLFSSYQSIGARGYYEIDGYSDRQEGRGTVMTILGWIIFFGAGYVFLGPWN